jgi:hypothetical protein
MNPNGEMKDILHKKNEQSQQQSQFSEYARRINGRTTHNLDGTAHMHDRLPDEQNRRIDQRNLRK